MTHQPPILTETKYHNQTRYEIKDKELEGFIKMCVILFAQDVYLDPWNIYTLKMKVGLGGLRTIIKGSVT